MRDAETASGFPMIDTRNSQPQRLVSQDLSVMLLCLLVVIHGSAACGRCGDDRVPARVRKTVMIDGAKRSYDVWLPSNFDKQETYWLMIAGFGPVERYWALLEQAELRAILVKPKFQLQNVPRARMAFPSRGEGGAILKMIEHLRASHRVHSKVLLTGFSGGANFAHRFAFQHSEVVLACAPYAPGSWSTPDGRFLVYGIGEVRDARTFANGDPIPATQRAGRGHYLNDWAVKAGKQIAPPAAKKVPFLVMCGSQDTERLGNAKEFAQSLESAGFQVETAWPDTDHELTMDVQRRIVTFFKKVVEDVDHQ